jgi:hypothetical protein
MVAWLTVTDIPYPSSLVPASRSACLTHSRTAVSVRSNIERAAGSALTATTSAHLDNALKDYRREIQRRVFG